MTFSTNHHLNAESFILLFFYSINQNQMHILTSVIMIVEVEMSFKRFARFILFILLFSIVLNITAFSEGSIEESYVFPIVENIIKTKNKAFIAQDEEAVKALYDMTRTSGKWACEHEIKRIRYLKNWSDKQGVVFTDINSNLVIRWTRMKDNGNMVANMLASTSYYYAYEDRPEDITLMRIGTYHLVEMTQKDGKWSIDREWYTDPFADSLELDNLKMEQNKKFILSNEARDFSNLNPRRLGVIEYADRYCGAAASGEHGYSYNPKYKNYNSIGGDCANFASQCMHEGGKLRKNSVWNYDKEGSMAWLSARGLYSYIVSSGRGSLIVSGNYNTVLKLSYKLLPGDIVAYEKNGKIAHISVVTGQDSRGYALVNCHNTDRYRVPWDLGWSNKKIKFHFIRVHY
jgi:hypothetical protein